LLDTVAPAGVGGRKEGAKRKRRRVERKERTRKEGSAVFFCRKQ
jgi:hypothetical protein